MARGMGSPCSMELRPRRAREGWLASMEREGCGWAGGGTSPASPRTPWLSSALSPCESTEKPERIFF
jgi:hypothetical protein